MLMIWEMVDFTPSVFVSTFDERLTVRDAIQTNSYLYRMGEIDDIEYAICGMCCMYFLGPDEDVETIQRYNGELHKIR